MGKELCYDLVSETLKFAMMLNTSSDAIILAPEEAGYWAKHRYAFAVHTDSADALSGLI
jgi:hypothetical protein